MADLKVGTTVGGSTVWNQGNLPLTPTGNLLLYKDNRVYTNLDKPSAADLGVVNKAGDTMTGALTVQGAVVSTIGISTTISSAGNFILSGNALGGYAELVGKPKTSSDWQYASGLRFYPDNTWRIGDKKVYFEGFLPTPSVIGAVSKTGDTMIGQLTFTVTDSTIAQISSMASYPSGTKNYLRRFRGGTSDTVWHETVQGVDYRLSHGATLDGSVEVMKVTNSGSVYLSGTNRVYADNYHPRSDGLSRAFTWGTDQDNFNAGFQTNGECKFFWFDRDSINGPNKSQAINTRTDGYGITFGNGTDGGQISFGYGDQIAFRSMTAGGVGQWGYAYTTINKPTPTDIGAVNKAGDTMTGALQINTQYRGLAVGTSSADVNAWPNATNSDPNNYVLRNRASVIGGNGGLFVIGDGAFNARRIGIQSGHTQSNSASSVGVLELNPFGGDVRVNGSKAYTEDTFKDAPLPDVCIPLNDNISMFTGYGDEIRVGGYLVAKLIRFSRNGTATYTDKSGVLRSAAINEPRFEKEGLLIEGSATNLITMSSVVSAKNLFSDTGTTVLCPLNGSSERATVYSSDGDTTDGWLRFGSVSAGVVSDTKTASCYVIAIERDMSVAIKCEGGISKTYDLKANVWTRLEVTRTAPTTANSGFIDISISNPQAGYKLATWGAQLETGSRASSLVITTGGPITRSADVCYIDDSRNMPGDGKDVTIAVESDLKITTAVSMPSVIGISTGANPALNSLRATLESNGSTSLWAGARSDYVADKILPRNIVVLSIRDYKSVTSLNGEIISKTATDTNAGSYISFQTGHIRNVRIWHSALSDAQIKRLN